MMPEVSTRILNGLKVLEMCSWLLDTYVLDYFTGNHWNKLPFSWKTILENTEPQELVQFLSPESLFCGNKRVWPLSLMCLHVVSSRLSAPRNPVKLQTIFDDSLNAEDILNLSVDEKSDDIFLSEIKEQRCYLSGTAYRNHPKLQYIFTKRVKPKKQHEISVMAQVTANIAKKENCLYVLDIGSGLGHLARMLAYGYGLKVCCLEAQEELSIQARKLDLELETSASKVMKEERTEVFRPVHINMTLCSELSADMFMNAVKAAFGILHEDFSFGIVGLHPCGDLAPILMHLFVQCPNARFINIVGCCYMKLTTENVTGFCGYPMSKFLSNKFCLLNYEAREIACHAVESYRERLSLGQYENLKVHCYRAVLEKILVKHWPHLKHTLIKSVKHTADMSFTQYVTSALKKLGLKVPQSDLESEETRIDLLQWKKVVIFYTLRLMLAPLVETVVLFDRLLFLQELGVKSLLVPLFDPTRSPRNIILIGRKKV